MKKILLFYVFCLVAWPMMAQDGDGASESEYGDSREEDLAAEGLAWPRNVQARIDRIVQDDLLDVSQMGLMVWDLTADSAIYRYYERQLLRPASVMKALTAIVALDQLGGGYELCTSVYCDGQLEGGTLRGDVYVVGGMDPMLDGADLHALATALRQAGIDTVAGRLVADLSMKDTLRWGEGWCWDDDNPTLAPLSMGRDVRVLEPLAEAMAEAGIGIDGMALAEGRKPDGAVLAGQRRHPVDQLLMKMMKESDNFYAECLLYQTAASTGYRPARASDAHALTRRLINRLGLNGSDYRLADGSGLSLYNYVSAELMVRLLRHAWRRQDIWMHLLPSLPIAGQDGTLAKRMTRSAAEGNVRAKTGTLTGIASLAGYCTAANGHVLCFCIINQGLMRSRYGRALQDRLCNALCQPW